jgi:hypothetical protein
MTTINTPDGRPTGAPPVPPLLLGCGEPLRSRSAAGDGSSRSSGRGRPALSIQLPARLFEQRLTRQRR